MKARPRILRVVGIAILGSEHLPANAFTLMEVVISIAITVSILFACATIAVSELTASIKFYVYQAFCIFVFIMSLHSNLFYQIVGLRAIIMRSKGMLSACHRMGGPWR